MFAPRYFRSGDQVRLISATAFAVIASVGAAKASSIVVLGGDATTVSSIVAGSASPSARSIIQLGAPAIDKGKVASVEIGPAPMVIRGGEVGAASAQSAASAPVAAPGATQATDNGAQTPPVAAAK